MLWLPPYDDKSMQVVWESDEKMNAHRFSEDHDMLFVTYRPEQNVAGEVSFTGGYPFAEGSTATMDIGGTTFELFTEGEYAWPATPADDQKIMTAIKRGVDATITARSSRGTQTKDTFSLLGATAMIAEAEKRCTGG